jgi:hypothetical protein
MPIFIEISRACSAASSSKRTALRISLTAIDGGSAIGDAGQETKSPAASASASAQFWIGLILRCPVQKSTPVDYDRVASASTYAFQNDTPQQLSGDPYQ